MSGSEAVIALMKEAGIEINRKNFIEVNWLGTPPDPWDAEAEEEIPEELRQETEGETKTAGKIEETSKGKVIVNPSREQLKGIVDLSKRIDGVIRISKYMRDYYVWTGSGKGSNDSIHISIAADLGLVGMNETELIDCADPVFETCKYDIARVFAQDKSTLRFTWTEHDLKNFLSHSGSLKTAEMIDLNTKQTWENPSKLQLQGILNALKRAGADYGYGDLSLRFVIFSDGTGNSGHHGVVYGLENNLTHDQIMQKIGLNKARWPYCKAGHMNEEKLKLIPSTEALRRYEEDHSLMRGRYSTIFKGVGRISEVET